MYKLITKSFSQQTKNAVHIYPPINLKPKVSIYKEIQGVKLPLMEVIKKKHTTVIPQPITRFSDSDSTNHMKILVNKNTASKLEALTNEFNRNERRIPFSMGEKTPEKYKSLVFKSEVLQTSSKKAKPVLKAMIGKYFYDGILAGKATHKKVGHFLSSQLNDFAIKKLEEEGFDPKFMFITSIVVNMTKRVKRVRYHAKGRGCMMERDWCLFKITITEKPIKEFFKMMILGKSPPYIGYMMKEYLEKNDCSYEEVRKLQLFLTGRGRQQQRLMFHRKVLTKWIEYKQMGVFIRISLLRELMLEKETEEFHKKYHSFFLLPEEMRKIRITERKIQFAEKSTGVKILEEKPMKE